MHRLPPLFFGLLLPALLAAAPSRLNKDLPGFHPDLVPIALGEADAALPGALDLTVLAAGVVEGRAVIRIGTREPFSGRLRLEHAGGESLFWDGAVLRDGNGRIIAGADARSMPGAAVFELWLPAQLGSWSAAVAGGAGLRLYSEDERGAVDELGGAPGREARTAHHVAFVHHGNQGLTWSDVFWGHEPNAHEQHWDDYLDTGSLHNGFDEILGLHDLLDIPANFQIAGPLQTGADWYYPGGGAVEGWNDWVARGVDEGWAALLASAYAQHIMPFVEDSMNNWSVHTHVQMTAQRYGYQPHTAWVPERVWVSPQDNDGNPWDTSDHVIDWIGDNWLPHGVWGVLLDQEEHCGYENNWANDRHIYTIDVPDQGQLNIFPINGAFTGACHHDAGAAWNMILGLSPDELLIYGTDWEVVAEVAGFEQMFPNALNNMIWLVQQIAASGGSVASMKLDEAYGGFGGGAINLQNGTYGLLGGLGGYGSDFIPGFGRNSWYGHWAATASPSDQHDPPRTYGYVWHDTWNRLMSGPENGFAQLGWFTLMTKLYETGWHDGPEISGWIHRYASHIKNAGVYAEGARWLDGSAWTGTAALLHDIDHDGADELVLHSDRLFVVFEQAGGRAPWIFSKGPGGSGSVVGSCNAYWVETEGDYNDGSANNHVAAFSEVQPWLEHEPYSMAVDSLGSGFARVRLEHGSLAKTISLAAGEPWLTVDYEATGEVRIKHGFTPDYLGLLHQAGTERLWDPQAVWPQADWMGQRNPASGLSAALVLGNGGARHGGDFQGTLVRGDEIVGEGRFRYLFYAGPTTGAAGGQVPELAALAQQSLDVTPPRMAPAAGFLAPDKALLEFDEDVQLASAESTASYALEGFPPEVQLVSATRQAWARRVELRLSGLASGVGGTIRAAGVRDLAGNLCDPEADAASFQMPDGLTPHTIIIDGLNDFSVASELLEPRADSLFLTWDQEALYIGFKGRNLGGQGDFFLHLDTDLQPGSGAPAGSWGRVSFTASHRPEYEIAVEGGGNSAQLNAWDGSWSYLQYGQHPCTSYEGWAGNLLTELRIPWNAIGNPDGLAICATLTQEDNQVTVLAWPQTNPTGNGVTLGDWFIFAEPALPGPLPAAGVRPNQLEAGPPPAVSDLAIEYMGGGVVRLSWSPSPGAGGYRVYELAAPWAGLPAEPLAETAATEILLPAAGALRLFSVTAATTIAP
jgi:hypothetical protein